MQLDGTRRSFLALTGTAVIGAGVASRAQAGAEDVVARVDEIPYQMVWSRTHDVAGVDHYGDVTTTATGGYLFAGAVETNDGQNTLLVKTDGEGNERWTEIHGMDHPDRAHGVTLAPNGDFVVVGSATTEERGIEPYAMGVGADGNLRWRKTYGNAGDRIFDHVLPWTNGEVFVAGRNRTGNQTQYNLHLRRIDARGGSPWSRTIERERDVLVNDLTPTADGSVLLAGRENYRGNGDVIVSDSFVSKFDANGSHRWTYRESEKASTVAHAVIQLPDKTFAVAGERRPKDEYAEGFVLQLERIGSTGWQEHFDADRDTSLRDLALLNDDTIVAVGTRDGRDSWSETFATKVTRGGFTRWQKRLGDESLLGAENVFARGETGFLVTGQSSTGGQARDLYLGFADHHNESPSATATADPTSVTVGERVTFTAMDVTDPDSEVTAIEWDFDGDGKYEGSGTETHHTFEEPGEHEVTLRVTDEYGGSTTSTVTVSVREPEGTDEGGIASPTPTANRTVTNATVNATVTTSTGTESRPAPGFGVLAAIGGATAVVLSRLRRREE